MRNYLCLLGWSPKDNREKIEIDEVVRLFELEKIHRNNASFDLAKCTWLNGEYVRELPDERFRALASHCVGSGRNRHIEVSRMIMCAPRSIPAKGSSGSSTSCRHMAASISRTRSDYQPEGVAKHFIAENKPRLQALRDAFAALENFDATSIEAVLKATAAQLGLKASALVHPARLAVTGSNAGPSLYHLLEILGKAKVLARIDRALSLF